MGDTGQESKGKKTCVGSQQMLDKRSDEQSVPGQREMQDFESPAENKKRVSKRNVVVVGVVVAAVVLSGLFFVVATSADQRVARGPGDFREGAWDFRVQHGILLMDPRAPTPPSRVTWTVDGDGGDGTGGPWPDPFPRFPSPHFPVIALVARSSGTRKLEGRWRAGSHRVLLQVPNTVTSQRTYTRPR